MTLKRLTYGSDPVIYEQVQEYLNAPDDDLGVISLIVDAASQHVEKRVQRQFLSANWRLNLDRFPRYGEVWSAGAFVSGETQYDDTMIDWRRGVVELRVCPVQSVTSVQYYDMAGVLQTLSDSLYDVDVDSEPGRLLPSFGNYWPITQPRLNAVQIAFTAGYVVGVPASALQAIYTLAGHWYDNRDCFTAGSVGPQVAVLLDHLIDDLRWSQ